MAGWIDSGNSYGPGTKTKNANQNQLNTSSNSGSTTGTTTRQTMTAANGRTLADTSNKASKSSLASKTTYDPNVEDEDTSSDYWDSYLSQIQSAEAAQKAAIQAAVDQSVNSLNAQKTTTAQDYADAYRQLYLNNMKSQKNIGQQMAAQGVTGGASESTLLGLNTNYEDNLRQGKVAEQNALSALDQAIIDAQLSGSIESANNTASNAQNTANAYLTAWQQQLANEQSAKELAASQASENRSYNYQMAMAMLQTGSMPSDALLNSAGISKADAQTIVAQYQAAKASGGNGGSGSGSKSTANASGTMKYGEWGNSQSDYDTWNTLNAYVKNSVLNGDSSGALKHLNNLYTDGTIDWTTVRRLKNIYNLGN